MAVHSDTGIGTLSATQGPMGTTNTAVTVTTGSNAGIEFLAADSMHANVTTSGTGSMRQFYIRKGDFRGALSVYDLKKVGDPAILPELEIRDEDGNPHNLIGTLTFRNTIVNDNSAEPEIDITGEISATGRIFVGGSLPSGAEIVVGGTQGLEGQVTLNSGDIGGTWAGTVKIGSITLSPTQNQPDQAPYYERTSASLGGGAVGVAPFTLHNKDCVPINGATLQTVLSSVVLRHYGPVKRAAPNKYPIKIERGPAVVPEGEPVTYTDVTSQFTVAIDSDDSKLMTLTRTDGLTLNGYRYRITPITFAPPTAFTRLKCKDVTNEPDVQSWTYEIIVKVPLP